MSIRTVMVCCVSSTRARGANAYWIRQRPDARAFALRSLAISSVPAPWCIFHSTSSMKGRRFYERIHASPCATCGLLMIFFFFGRSAIVAAPRRSCKDKMPHPTCGPPATKSRICFPCRRKSRGTRQNGIRVAKAFSAGRRIHFTPNETLHG